jgi:Prolyl oligopeptidase family
VRLHARVLLLCCVVAAPAHARDEKLPLTLDDGRVLEATLRWPDGAAPAKLPALMLFGGFRGAARVLDKVQAPRPLVWATFDYPFEPPRKFRFPASLADAPAARAAIHGSFEGIEKLHQALARHPRIDAARITVIGASAGAPFATVGAARQPIPGMILVEGLGDVPLVIGHLIARKYQPRYGDWVRFPARWLARWLNWYCEIPDIAAQARRLRATQKVLMVTATQDDFIPQPATEALWQALEASQSVHERIDLEGSHLGVGDDRGRIAEILRRSMQWLEQHALL